MIALISLFVLSLTNPVVDFDCSASEACQLELAGKKYPFKGDLPKDLCRKLRSAKHKRISLDQTNANLSLKQLSTALNNLSACGVHELALAPEHESAFRLAHAASDVPILRLKNNGKIALLWQAAISELDLTAVSDLELLRKFSLLHTDMVLIPDGDLTMAAL